MTAPVWHCPYRSFSSAPRVGSDGFDNIALGIEVQIHANATWMLCLIQHLPIGNPRAYHSPGASLQLL